MKIAQVVFNIAALLKISIVLFPAREQIYIFYRIKRSRRNRFLMTLILVIISFTVPAVYPDITSILGLIGGIMMGSTGYSIPLLLKLASIRSKPFSLQKLGIFLLFCGVVIVQVLSAYVCIFMPSSGGGGH